MSPKLVQTYLHIVENRGITKALLFLRLIKFRHSEKATKIFHLIWHLLSKCQIKWKIVSSLNITLMFLCQMLGPYHHVELISVKVSIIRLDYICFEKSSSTFWQERCCAHRTRRSCQKYARIFSNFVAFSENPNFNTSAPLHNAVN